MALKYIYTLLLTFFGSGSFSQVIIKAAICNSQSQPLSYTNVASLATNISISSDEAGRFELSDLSINDTLKFTNIAFLPLLLPVKSLLKSDTIFLKDNIKILSEVVVHPRKEHEVDLGYFKYPNNASFRLLPGSQIATLIANKGKEGYIKGVRFKLKNKGKCKNSMRVRLFEIDPVSLTPVADVLNENIIISYDKLKSDNYIDLSQYGINFPQNGIFVVLEWIYTDVTCDKNSYSVVAANMTISKDIVWFNVRDKQWKHGFRPRVFNGNFITPNISVSVLIPE